MPTNRTLNAGPGAESGSQGNPLAELLRSRKFLVLLLDTVVSIVLYFGSKYLGDGYFADVKFLIGVLQAPALMMIYAISSENNALTRAQVLCSHMAYGKQSPNTPPEA